jgi:hypothetical protein
LRVAIFESGRTQRDIVAAIPGLREDQLSRIVNGLHTDEPTQKAIAHALGRQVAELFGESEEEAA